MRRFVVNCLVVIAALCLLALSAFAEQEERKAIPAYGWLQYCGETRDPTCRLSRHWTPEDLAFVNLSVNLDMGTAQDDEDRWLIFPIGGGDCEDAALSKRAALLALGFPPESLVLVVGEHELPDGQVVNHMVLEASLGEDDVWVLDINRNEIFRPGATKLPWRELARQVHGRVEWADTSAPYVPNVAF